MAATAVESDGTYVDAKDVARRWGISRQAVYAMARAGILRCVRGGAKLGRVRLLAADVARHERERGIVPQGADRAA